MRGRVAAAAVLLASGAATAGCSGSSGSAGGGATSGTLALEALCPQVHRVIDDLVVSDPEAQRQFVADLERLEQASSLRSRTALAPLLDAGRALAAAGRGSGYRAALEGIFPAQQAVDAVCVEAGAPILHDGPHR